MSSERRSSGFGIGFSKEVDSILMAAQLGHVYPNEVRENLRLAGMVLTREAEMTTFNFDPVTDGEETYDGIGQDYEGDTDGA